MFAPRFWFISATLEPSRVPRPLEASAAPSPFRRRRSRRSRYALPEKRPSLSRRVPPLPGCSLRPRALVFGTCQHAKYERCLSIEVDRHLRSTRDAPVSEFGFIHPRSAPSPCRYNLAEMFKSAHQPARPRLRPLRAGAGGDGRGGGRRRARHGAPVPRGRHSRPRRGARVPGRRQGRRRGRRVRLLLGVSRPGARRGAETDRRAPTPARGGPRGGRAGRRVGRSGASRGGRPRRDAGARGDRRRRRRRTERRRLGVGIFGRRRAPRPPVPPGRRRSERRRPRRDVARRRGLAAQGLRRRRRRTRPERQRQDEGAFRGRRRRARARPPGFDVARHPSALRQRDVAHGHATSVRGLRVGVVPERRRARPARPLRRRKGVRGFGERLVRRRRRPLFFRRRIRRRRRARALRRGEERGRVRGGVGAREARVKKLDRPREERRARAHGGLRGNRRDAAAGTRARFS